MCLYFFLYVFSEGSFINLFRAGIRHGIDKFDPLGKLQDRGLLFF